jgi:hypothetical protein
MAGCKELRIRPVMGEQQHGLTREQRTHAVGSAPAGRRRTDKVSDDDIGSQRSGLTDAAARSPHLVMYPDAAPLEVDFQETGERGVDAQEEHVHHVHQGHPLLAKRN